MKNRLFGYEKQTRFSFRKMSIGLISCGIGAFWIMGGTVMADEVTENTAESDIETVSTRTISEETTPVEVVKKSTVSIEKMSEQRELEGSAKQMIDLSEPHLKSKDVLEVGDTSVIPTVTTSASTEANRSITDEEAKTSEARLEETGVTNLRHVTIPEGVTEIGSSAFSDNPQLTKITLPSSLKKIGSNAFNGTNLTSIDLPEGLEEIGSEAFSGTKLTELVLPSSLKRIDAYAFRNISTLTKVHIPAHLESASNVFAYNYGDGTASPITEVSFESGIESIPSGLFDGVSSLTNVTIPSTVKRIGASAFSRTTLAEISIPEGVEYIGSSAFGNIERLKKVTLPSSVTDASYAFSGSRNLTDVKLGAGFTKLPDGLLSGTGITEFVVPEGVTEIGSSAFSDNPQLTKITLPSSLKKIGSNAFNGTNLTSIDLPEGLEEIGSEAFSGTKLTELVLPSSLKRIDAYAFRNISTLTKVHIPAHLESASNVFAYYNGDGTASPITEVSFESGIESIPSGLFNGVSSLTNVTIPSTVKRIGASAFSRTTLAEISIPEGVEYIGSSAFGNIERLKKVTLPSSVTDASYAFSGSRNLTDVKLGAGFTKLPDGLLSGTGITEFVVPEGVTEIGSSAFSDNPQLTKITLPSSLKKIGSNAFNGTNLTSIDLPEGLEEIGSEAFSGTKLTELVLPSSLKRIDAYAFRNISTLTKVHIPAHLESASNVFAYYNGDGTASPITEVSFESGIESIPSGLFNGVSSLTNVTIPSTVKRIGASAFSRTTLAEISIPEGVEYIGSSAFGNIERLKKVTLPSSVTDASYAFSGSRNLTDVKLGAGFTKLPDGLLSGTGITEFVVPEGVTEIGSSAFSDNPQLTKITLPSSLKKIGSNAFYGTNLTSIDLPEGLEEIGSEAFSGTKLTELVLPSSLKRIDAYAFRNISTLTKVHIPAHLESASNVFAYNYGDGTASPITEVSFESGIESIPSGLFDGVSSLTNVTIPSTVKRIGASAFSRTTLAEISIPEGVEYIGSSAFGNIERLKKVTLPSSVTNAYNAFSGSRNLTDVKLGAGFTKLPDSFLSGTGVTEFVVPEGVTEIGSSAFSDNPQLTKITLPSSLKKIGSNAYYGTNLTSIDLPEGLEEIGSEAFSGTKLTELVLPSSLKRIDAYAFRNISTLTKVHIPAHLESASNVFAYYDGDGTASPITEVSFESGIESIPSGLFNGVSSLTNVTIPSTVKRIGSSAFSGTTLAEISIPEGVEEIGSSAFGNIESLKKVTLPSSVTNAYNAFSGSRKLTDVKLGDGFTKLPDGLLSGTGITEFVVPEGVTEIGSSAFSDNPQLTKITLPSSLKKIGHGAFYGTNLTSIDLPEGLEEIGSNAFWGTKLTELVLPSSLKRIDSYAFRNISTLTKVHIPAHLESASNVFAYYDGDGTASPITEVSFESGIESIPSGLFNGVSSLTNVTIPSTVKRIGSSAFSGTTLAEISIPEGVEEIGSSAFGNIESLKKVTLPSSVTNAYNAFSGSRKLTDVKLGDGFTKLPDGLLSGTGITEFVVPEGVTEIGSSTFSDNPQLTKITLPSSLKKIGSNAFNGTGLTSLAIPEGVTDIGSYAFSSTPLERIILPTGLKIIGSGAFRNTKLIEIEIPEGVEYLDDYTLADNPQLKKVYLPKSITALVNRWGEQLPDAEFHVYLDSFALEYMIEHQLNFKLRDENVANDESKILDSQSSYYLPTTSSSRRQGYLGLDLKYSLKDGKSSDDGTYNLKLNIPASTTIFDGKVRYNGTDIPVSVQEGYITIPVTEKEGKIKLMLTSGNKELTNLRLFAQLAYQKDGQKVAEVIGATNVTVPVLTLTANKATSRSYSRISGIADPADRVTAYLDEQSVGLIKVKKDGTYTLDIPLANPVNNKEYKIKVVALSPDGQELSEVTTVRYEEKLPELENFIMRHNGYAYNMKEHKDKVPVINFRPGGKFEFEAEYTNTEQIENVYLVSTREGIKKYVQLYYDENLKKYIYHGYFDEKNTSYVPGKLELQIINKEKRIPSILVELEGKKIDYLSSEFKEKYKIIDELNRDKFVTRIINRETQKVVLTEEISIDILKELFDNIQNNSESQPKKSSILVKEKENNLGFRSAEGTKGEPILNLFYALLLEEAGIINLNQFLNPAKFALDELYKIPELIFRKYAGLSKDLTTVSDNVFDGIKDKLLENKAVKDEIAKVPGLDKVVNNIGLFQELGNFVLKWSMLELLEKLLEEPKLVIQGNYKYNALQTIKREKNNFINSSIKSIGVSAASIGIHVRLGALIYDFGATLYNFSRGLGGKLEKWERIPTVSGLPESFYENIIDDLKIGAPTLTDLKVKTKLETKTSFTKKMEEPDTDSDGLYSLKYTTTNTNSSGFTTSSIPTFQFIIDPSGVVINDISNNPVTGATTTLYYKGENGEEVLWDAGEYSQLNPLSTTVNGEYAWDVPEGQWKVKVSKDGYESAESDWLPVPPPQTEVHFKLKPLSYTLSYQVGDGSLGKNAASTYQTDVDTALPYPVRKGYTFAGWYDNAAFIGRPYFNTLFETAGDKELFAKWEKASDVLSDDESTLSITVNGIDTTRVSSISRKSVESDELLKKLPLQVSANDVSFTKIQLLDSENKSISLTEEAEVEMATIGGRKPIKLLHYLADEDKFKEVPFKWIESNHSLAFSMTNSSVYAMVYQLSDTKQEVKVHKESRILTTNEVTYLDDPSLDTGRTREIPAVAGQVVVEITEIYVNGDLQSSTEKELSRTPAQAKKVYRGTKLVTDIPNVAPIEEEKPEAKLETKVRQVIRVLTTDEVVYLDDPSLDTGRTREIPAVAGQVVVEITEIYVNGDLQSSAEKELSRTPAQAKKVYRGTRSVSSVPSVAPTTPELSEEKLEMKTRLVVNSFPDVTYAGQRHSQIVYKNRKEESTLPETGEKIYSVSVLTGLSLMLAGLYTMKKKEY